MAGKQCVLSPEDGGSVSLLFESLFDLSQLGSKFKDLPPVQSPGVLPGSSKLMISVPLNVKDGKYVYSIDGETEAVTYSLKGSISDKLLTADFSNVKLKNQTFTGGVWAPMPASGLPTADTQPFHIVWETALPIPFPELEYTIQDMLRILVNIPMIPVYNNTAEMSLSQVIANGLKTVAFNPDGNILVTYLQTANGASVFTLAPKCAFQYVPLTDKMLSLFINPTDLLSLILLNNDKKDPNIPENPWKKNNSISGGRVIRNSEVSSADLFANIAKLILPMVAQGFPTNSVIDGKQMQLYIGTEVLLPLLKQGVVPMLQDPSVVAMIGQYISDNESLRPYAKELTLLLEILPTLMDQTTRLEIGLNLTKAI